MIKWSKCLLNRPIYLEHDCTFLSCIFVPLVLYISIPTIPTSSTPTSPTPSPFPTSPTLFLVLISFLHCQLFYSRRNLCAQFSYCLSRLCDCAFWGNVKVVSKPLVSPLCTWYESWISSKFQYMCGMTNEMNHHIMLQLF